MCLTGDSQEPQNHLIHTLSSIINVVIRSSDITLAVYSDNQFKLIIVFVIKTQMICTFASFKWLHNSRTSWIFYNWCFNENNKKFVSLLYIYIHTVCSGFDITACPPQVNVMYGQVREREKNNNRARYM